MKQYILLLNCFKVPSYWLKKFILSCWFLAKAVNIYCKFYFLLFCCNKRQSHICPKPGNLSVYSSLSLSLLLSWLSRASGNIPLSSEWVRVKFSVTWRHWIFLIRMKLMYCGPQNLKTPILMIFLSEATTGGKFRLL